MVHDDLLAAALTRGLMITWECWDTTRDLTALEAPALAGTPGVQTLVVLTMMVPLAACIVLTCLCLPDLLRTTGQGPGADARP